MNILFITDLYPVKSDEKTTPRTLLAFAEEWGKMGHNVDILKPNFILNSFLRGKPFYKSGQYEDVFNVNYWTPFLGNVKSKLPNLQKYDIVVAHMPSGILFADKFGLPFVAGIHNSDIEVLTNPLYKIHFKPKLEKALKNAKAIACRSFVLQDKLLKLYPEFEEKTFVALSGIDEKLLDDMNHSLLTTHHSPIKIITCAHFKKRKNIDKVIKACKGLEGFELTVIGDGKERKNLEKIDKNVIFTGRLPHDEVLAKMRESDVFVLPSVGETFGMVYLEAMASGCITVCTKGDGIDGIIKNGENGFLTEPTVENIRETLLNIKKLDSESLKTLHINSFNTIHQLTSTKCAEHYLQQILRFCKD